MEIKCKPGDSIGMINKKYNEENFEWYLIEDKITSMRMCKDGMRIYSKRFRPLDYEDVISNNNILMENNRIMLIREVLLLTDEVRERVEAWIEWANKNIDEAVPIISAI